MSLSPLRPHVLHALLALLSECLPQLGMLFAQRPARFLSSSLSGLSPRPLLDVASPNYPVYNCHQTSLSLASNLSYPVLLFLVSVSSSNIPQNRRYFSTVYYLLWISTHSTGNTLHKCRVLCWSLFGLLLVHDICGNHNSGNKSSPIKLIYINFHYKVHLYFYIKWTGVLQSSSGSIKIASFFPNLLFSSWGEKEHLIHYWTSECA